MAKEVKAAATLIKEEKEAELEKLTTDKVPMDESKAHVVTTIQTATDASASYDAAYLVAQTSYMGTDGTGETDGSKKVEADALAAYNAALVTTTAH